MAALLALASALCFGVSDFSGGLASRRAAATSIVLVSNGLSLLLAVVAVALVPGSTLVAGDLAWGAAGGAVGVFGVVLLYRGLAIGPMAVVAPLTAVLSAVVPVLVGVALGERPGWVAIVGVVAAVPAIALVSGARAGAAMSISRQALLAALAAGLSFGGFYVLLARTGPHGGAWPLVGQRAASVAVLTLVTAFSLARRRRVAIPARVLGLAVLAGLTDFLANLTYLLATHRGLLALVAVLSSLYPATTVVLAGAVLRERLSARQLGGLTLAVAAVALIAL